MTKILTIGFTKTSAENFFDRLDKAGVKKVLDVRLNNTSQLAGFAKAKDLSYFLDRMCGIEYHHALDFAPTAEMLSAYKKGDMDWSEYESQYLDLITARKLEDLFQPGQLADACLLCSEDTPHHCHRRLAAEYLNRCWGGALDIIHL